MGSAACIQAFQLKCASNSSRITTRFVKLCTTSQFSVLARRMIPPTHDPTSQMDSSSNPAASTSLEALRNEVLRKIGRNVILFQDLERLLKFLARACRWSGPVSQLQRIDQERVEKYSRKTLGEIVGEIHHVLYADIQETESASEITEARVSFSFSLEPNAELDEQSKKALVGIVKERNDLIHHLLQRWNMFSTDSCQSVSRELDQQRRRAIVEIRRYKAIKDALIEGLKEAQQRFAESRVVRGS